ncbi:MAG: alpha/beta hydrolase [Spirochaetes bacterium]|nr:alpha/beta hydrolase [Spirochaetota bacterium]
MKQHIQTPQRPQRTRASAKWFTSLAAILLLTAPVQARDGYTVTRNIHYVPGTNYQQTLDIYTPTSTVQSPMVVFIHGGGWQKGDKTNIDRKADYFTSHGYVFASINHRLSPAVTHPAHVDDVAHALAYLASNSTRFHGDTNRIYLIGHSSGAHLAALVAVDARPLRACGQTTAIIKGVILLDTAAYDIPLLLARKDVYAEQRSLYEIAFTRNIRTQKDASPQCHIAKNTYIPSFLVLYISERSDSKAASERFSAALTKAGASAMLSRINKTHDGINKDVGIEGDALTKQIMDFLTAGDR